METNNDPVLSASMLADRWGVTSRHVSELAKKGIAIRASAGGYYGAASTLSTSRACVRPPPGARASATSACGW